MIPPPDVQVEHLSFRESGQFSTRDIAYAELDERLLPFMQHVPQPTLEGHSRLSAFAKTIHDRQQFAIDRHTLVEVLQEQYSTYGMKCPGRVKQLLDTNTFTIVTAHQASLFLGPLYYVYKILSTVTLSRKLKKAYPDYEFVPVFVLGAEDHDLEEIDHLRIGSETITWQTQQTGATGAMHLREIEPAYKAVSAQLGNSSAANYLRDLLHKCYHSEANLGEATAHFVAELFGEYGVLVANLNHPRLKQNFAKHIKREVFEQVSQPLIEAQQAQLDAAGFAAQAHARAINFFYLQPGRRDRLVVEEGHIQVLDTDIRWTPAQLEQHIEEHPERFSPNVVMRPLLQEFSLPNLAYVGGGGELAYWLERKTQFAAFGVPMPMLVRRDSAWWIDYKSAKQLDKLGLSPRDLLGDKHQLLRYYVTTHSEVDVDLSARRAQLQTILETISHTAQRVDPTLEQHVLAKAKLLDNDLAALEKRLVRQLKKQQADGVSRIEQLHQTLLPNGGLQERSQSFMELYARHGKHFFELLLANFDPLDMRLKVLVEQHG